MARTVETTRLHTPLSPFRRWIVSGKWTITLTFIILAALSFAIYRNIILPLTKPILSALAIFVFLGATVFQLRRWQIEWEH